MPGTGGGTNVVINVTVSSTSAAVTEWDYQTVASLAAGASADLDSKEISSGKDGELRSVAVGSGVPLKVTVQSVEGGTVTEHNTFFTQADRTEEFQALKAIAVAGGTGNVWRVTVTNLDTSEASDVYVTFIWDEV